MELYYWLARTMLIERLVGVAAYAVLLLLMYVAIRGSKNYRTLCKVLNVYLVLLCVMAFFYIPGKDADLSRWRDVFDQYWANIQFSDFLQIYVLRSATPIANLFIYACQRTGIDGILPAFCALIFYGNSFYILKDLYRRHQASAWGVAEATLLFMCAGCFLEVISGVRCMVALSILARCFYNEIYNEKPFVKGAVWEVLAALIHSMAAVLLIGRLFFWLFQKSQKNIVKLLNLGLVLVFAAVMLTYGADYLRVAVYKAIEYINDADTYAYVWEYIIRGIVSLQILIIFVGIKGKCEKRELKDLVRFNLVWFVIDIIFSFNYSIFHRLNTFLILMMLPLAVVAIDQNRNRRLDIIIKLLALTTIVLACTRGNLCGYKFFLL